ncbi:zinc-regulated transporter 1 [Gaeumannomyces tritici R3-111a-1]|uniref:Zinc-regulated transporter 1 n=1 Tax=Gaeumannomyces tritici (strain R3-111a-1) TaxID=644352 RepID=J3NQN7_GAET3|nr:zinc-regulated transporter 1 [Gaeumannomyces tritici R3-111a-1]EJT78493.1 zinc-regulated transporter 1 [Gaeumannomyces tritici R3-111a-1]
MNASSLVATQGFSWSSIPTELLTAELARRDNGGDSKPQCGSKERGHYDTTLHVLALGLILFLSTLSCAFPLISSSRSKGRRQSRVVFICQHFGTGVLIATAFVHLLPTAFISLTDPCLPYIFSKGYTAFPGLIAMVSALIVVSLESYLTTHGGATHSHTHEMWEEDEGAGVEDTAHDTRLNGSDRGGSHGLSGRRERRPSNIALDDFGDTEGLMAGASPLPGSTPLPQTPNGNTSRPQNGNQAPLDGGRDSLDSEESLDLELNLNELDPSAERSPKTAPQRRPLTQRGDQQPGSPGGGGSSLGQMPSPEEQRRLLLQCLLLEAGILFHSIFIGMALSVATGPPFVVFLVAISFHQSFEGLALGSRIAALHFPRSSPRPWLMVLAYGTTTPIGQAIGLLVHNMYDPMSQTGLLMVGFMNAISAGLLLFAGLVQLLAEDFLSEKSYKTLHGKRRLHAFLSVFGGATLMAIVGAFA